MGNGNRMAWPSVVPQSARPSPDLRRHGHRGLGLLPKPVRRPFPEEGNPERTPSTANADIGLIGLAVMGENLVLNMESHGYTVAVFNRTTAQG